jgi:hypothetical protein
VAQVGIRTLYQLELPSSEIRPRGVVDWAVDKYISLLGSSSDKDGQHQGKSSGWDDTVAGAAYVLPPAALAITGGIVVRRVRKNRKSEQGPSARAIVNEVKEFGEAWRRRKP